MESGVIVRKHPSARADIGVWDTHYCAPSKAFSVFREGLCGTFMPWSPEFKTGSEFSGRIESLSLGEAALGRVKMTPIVAHRTKLNIANSPLDCIYANYILRGEMKVEQGGRESIAKRGDLVVYDSSLPVSLTQREGGMYEDLAFRIPKCALEHFPGAGANLNNVVFSADKMIAPLSGTLAFLSENMLTASQEELDAIFSMCVSLLPIAAGCFANTEQEEPGGTRSNYLLREIREFINDNIANAELTPLCAARHIGVSTRYVHKLFAQSGNTFGAYVMARRLDQVRRDLSGGGRQPIYVVAYRWGFNDLSTFIRAFKKQYGCSPSQFRSNG